MTPEGQGRSEQTPRPPASTRWAEPGVVQGTGPVPPFVPRDRPRPEAPAHPVEPEREPDSATETDWTPESDTAPDPFEGVVDTEHAVDATDVAAGDTDDVVTDTPHVASDTTEAVDEAEPPDTEPPGAAPPILEYDISGPFQPLPRDAGGWISEDDDEMAAGPDDLEPVDDYDAANAPAPPEEQRVPVSELPPPSAAHDAETIEPAGSADTEGGIEEPPLEPQADDPAPGFDDGPPDASVELADRLEALAARIRAEGAPAARAEMESFDRFTALVAGLVSGFLAGHGR